MNLERRFVPVGDLEFRQDSGTRTIRGHAAVFNSESLPIFGAFVERISPGAFSRAIDEKQDVRALVDHDSSRILGRTAAGTLRLSEDRVGLAVEIDLPDTSVGRDIGVSIERGDVTQMSFGFRIPDRPNAEEFHASAAPNGMDLRIVNDVDLFDVSPVTFPAYPATDVSARADAEYAIRSHEAWRQRGSGMDHATASRLLALTRARQ